MFETTVVAEYLWVLVVLIFMEGVLAVDNACVMAVIVRELPESQRHRALFWGLWGAFFLRFASLFVISYLIDMWQIQAVGAVYLLFLSFKNIYQKFGEKNRVLPSERLESDSFTVSAKRFWITVLKVEISDIAFAGDSILAAIALALTLQPLGIGGHIGGMDSAKFLVIFLGGFAGVVLMRVAAQKVVVILDKRPSLETAAYALVGWVGVKLLVATLGHPAVGMISPLFIESVLWKFIFWSVFLAICVGGWIISGRQFDKSPSNGKH